MSHPTNPSGPSIAGPTPPQHIRWLAAGLLAAMVAGCGSQDPDPVSKAAADQVTVPWNTSTKLAVLANDVATGGTPELSITAAPQHGTAIVSGGTIEYTPGAKYFGSDTLSYQLNVGGKTSSATVTLSVEAQLKFNGLITDGVIPNASVTAKVGTQTFNATADAQGAYTVTVKSSNPADFVTLSGVGAGSQSHVGLTSHAGDLGSLAAGAQQGELTPSQAPALRVDHFNTARAGLLAQQNIKPGSTAELKTALDQLSSAEVAQAASLIKVVADYGAALPGTVKNTAELVANAGQLKAFLEDQTRNNAANLSKATAEVVADLAVVQAPPVPAGGALYAVTINSFGIVLNLKADGTGTLMQGAGFGAQPGTWTADGKTLTFMLTTPEDYGTSRTTGYAVRDVLGSSGSQQVNVLFSLLYEKRNAATGAWEAASSPFAPEMRLNPSAALPFGASEFADGAHWAGLNLNVPAYALQYGLYLQEPDTVFQAGQQVGRGGFSWALDKGELVFTGAAANTIGYSYRYSRLYKAPSGVEVWHQRLYRGAELLDQALLPVLPNGNVAMSLESVTRRWAKGYNVLAAGPTVIGSSGYRLKADGSATRKDAKSDTETAGYSWRFTSADKRELAIYRNGALRETWTFVAKASGRYFVMTRGPGVADPSSLISVFDMGAAE